MPSELMRDSIATTVLANFGLRIRQLRTAKSLSQEGLAEKCELDRTYIGGVERGERNISLVNMHRISLALDISLSELLKDE